MGIPFLYPWANRLSANSYGATGREGDVDTRRRRCSRRCQRFPDARGSGRPTRAGRSPTAAVINWRRASTSVRTQPFGVVSVQPRGSARGHAGGSRADGADHRDGRRFAGPAVFRVPPVFRHPRRPCAASGGWKHHRCVIFPSILGAYRNGSGGAMARDVGTSGDKTFDDGFDEVPDGAVFALSGGDRRIEIVFERWLPRRSDLRTRQ